ncbi:MAG: NAD(P)H-binding protein [Micropepsaceae bacterium]
MRILLLGAAGFIGRHVMSELISGGHDVVAVVRKVGDIAMSFPEVRFVAKDLARTTRPDDWSALVNGIDTVVNAAGILQGPDMHAVHIEMPKALLDAAQQAGVKRMVLISAISARPDVASDYARSKLAGEDVVRSAALDWTILRPSLVYGDGSYGGTSLVRGLAGLPWFTPLPGKGDFEFTPIHVRDLARATRLVCENSIHANQTLEPVGPETISLKTLLQHYRGWLGFGRARFISIPMSLLRVLGRVGDMAHLGPISTTSIVQMVAGNAGDSAAFAKAIGFIPQSLRETLRSRPSQVQDRWHARLFFMAPALKFTLVLMWLVSAVIGFIYGTPQTQELVDSLGMPSGWATPLRIGSSLLDLGVAALLIADSHARWSTIVQLTVILGYTTVIGIALPQLWIDPLGPLLKNLPILLAVAVHGVIGDQR